MCFVRAPQPINMSDFAPGLNFGEAPRFVTMLRMSVALTSAIAGVVCVLFRPKEIPVKGSPGFSFRIDIHLG